MATCPSIIRKDYLKVGALAERTSGDDHPVTLRRLALRHAGRNDRHRPNFRLIATLRTLPLQPIAPAFGGAL